MTDIEVQFEEIEESRYQELLNQTENHTFYNTSERFEFLRSQGRTIKFFGILNGKTPIGLLHFQIIPAKSGTLMYFQHTPLLFKAGDKEAIKKLFSALKEFTKKQLHKYNIAFARFTARIPKDYELLKDLYKMGYMRAPTQEIDAVVTRIVHIHDFEIKNIRKTTRNCINSALRAGLETKADPNPPDFETFLTFYNEMEKMKGFTPLKNEYIIKELENYRDKGMLTQYTTSNKNNEALSVAIVITFKDTAYYYHAATSAEGKRLNASHVNLFHIIEDLKKDKTIKVLDLWGGATPKTVNDNNIPHPWQNLDLFKRGYSDELLEFMPPLDLPRNWYSYIIPYSYQWYRTRKRGYPIVD